MGFLQDLPCQDVVQVLVLELPDVFTECGLCPFVHVSEGAVMGIHSFLKTLFQSLLIPSLAPCSGWRREVDPSYTGQLPAAGRHSPGQPGQRGLWLAPNFTHFIFFTEGTISTEGEAKRSIKYEWWTNAYQSTRLSCLKVYKSTETSIENFFSLLSFRVPASRAARILLLEFHRTLGFNIFLTSSKPPAPVAAARRAGGGGPQPASLQTWRALNILENIIFSIFFSGGCPMFVLTIGPVCRADVVWDWE